MIVPSTILLLFTVMNMNHILCRNVAGFLGFLLVTWYILKDIATIFGMFRAFFLAPWGISKINLKKYGEWAGIIYN